MMVKMVHTTKHGHQSARFCPTDTGGRLVLDVGISVDHGEMAASRKPKRAFNALRYIKIGGFSRHLRNGYFFLPSGPNCLR